MPSDPLYLFEQPRRRPHRRLTAIAFASAVAVLMALPALPAAGPSGQVLDLVGGNDGAAAIGHEPTPAGSPVPATESPVPSMAITPATSTQASSPLPGTISSGIAPRRHFGENTGTTAPPVAALEGYVWPIAHPRLTLPFGPSAWGSRVVDGERFHDGIDLATFCGDRIVAVHDGTVIAAGRHYDEFIGWVGDLGPYLRRLDQKGLWMTLPIVVVIDDGNGYRSVYAHFGKITVKRGQAVRAGQLIGYEGASGRASGCHLHLSVFSPWEPGTMEVRPDIAQRMKFPSRVIARIDPLLLLPPKPGINAPATPKPPAPKPSAPTP